MSEEKGGLFEKAMTFLKEKGDERIVKRVIERGVRTLKKTISATEDKIQSLEYDIEDAKVARDESYVDINVTNAKKDMDAYVVTWLASIKRKAEALSDLEDELAANKEILEATKELAKKVK